MQVDLKINNIFYKLQIKSNETLIFVLRDHLGLTGTKYVCGTGECGACVVLINNKIKLACCTLAANVAGKSIETIEGLEKNNKLSKLQKSFIKHGAIQCGYCTPGMIMTTKALLLENHKPNEKDVKNI